MMGTRITLPDLDGDAAKRVDAREPVLIGEIIPYEDGTPPGERRRGHEPSDRLAFAAPSRFHLGDHLAALHHEVMTDHGMIEGASNLMLQARHLTEMDRQRRTFVLEHQSVRRVHEGADTRPDEGEGIGASDRDTAVRPAHFGAVGTTRGENEWGHDAIQIRDRAATDQRERPAGRGTRSFQQRSERSVRHDVLRMGLEIKQRPVDVEKDCEVRSAESGRPVVRSHHAASSADYPSAAKAFVRKAGMSDALRQTMADATRELVRIGLNGGTAGNISVRDGSAMLITPSGILPELTTPDTIATMPLPSAGDAPVWEGPRRPSSEWRLHRDILLQRSDVGAVVHTHSTYATVLATQHREIPALHYMIAAFGGSRVRCTPYAPFGSQRLSDLIVEYLGSRHAVLLGNHGMVAVGCDLDQAMWRAGELETLAKLTVIAGATGAPAILDDHEVAAAIVQFTGYGPAAAR